MTNKNHGLESALLQFLKTPRKDSEIRAQFGLKGFDTLNNLLRTGQIRYLQEGKYQVSAANLS